MIRDDCHAIVLADVVQRNTFHLQVVMTSLEQHREVRVVVADKSALLPQQLDNGERRGLAQIIDILLVSHSKDKYTRAVQWLAGTVQRCRNRTHNVVRHGNIDLTGEFDEASLEVPLLRPP